MKLRMALRPVCPATSVWLEKFNWRLVYFASLSNRPAVAWNSTAAVDQVLLLNAEARPPRREVKSPFYALSGIKLDVKSSCTIVRTGYIPYIWHCMFKAKENPTSGCHCSTLKFGRTTQDQWRHNVSNEQSATSTWGQRLRRRWRGRLHIYSTGDFIYWPFMRIVTPLLELRAQNNRLNLLNWQREVKIDQWRPMRCR